jgi:hypothetical protein
MDIPNLEVVTLGGKRLSLKGNLQEAVRFLEEDGCLVVKAATDLSSIESMLATSKPPLDVVEKDTVLNDVSQVFIEILTRLTLLLGGQGAALISPSLYRE